MTAFWMMAHVLQRPVFAAALREEIAPVMQTIKLSDRNVGFTLIDISKRHLVDSCPLLNSAFNEVLRISLTGSTVREVMRPVRISSKTIPTATKVLLP
jgi:cytochrome P450